MKFTHCDYKYKSASQSSIKSGMTSRKMRVASSRADLKQDTEYYASWICIYATDKDITEFNLGIDYSYPNQTIRDRCEGRLFLNFIVKGKGTINGEPFSAGQFFYTRPLQKHTIQSDPDDPYVSVWIYVQGEYASYIENELIKKSNSTTMTLNNYTDVLELTKTFLFTINLAETSTSYLKHLINIYLSYISPNNELDYPEIFATQKITRLVYAAKTYISKNLKTVTVADLAANQRYNVKYFSRLFASATGMKPAEYITDCRIEWAKNSLEHSDLSVSEISEAIGYEHRNGFATAFRKKYGCSPTEYRRKTKGSNKVSE